MNIEKTALSGCYIIQPKSFTDERGIFFESFKKNVLEHELGYKVDFVQDNHSISYKGVLRGLHFQESQKSQAKMVRVVQGEVIDVVVDIRKNSKTFGEHIKVRLSATNRKILFIPKGMAHGFIALEDATHFVYKCDQYYNRKAEGGIIYDDPDLNIDWEFPKEQIILSKKDQKLPSFKELVL